jgi:Pyrimidine dimer DNA glycosylase
MRIWSLHPKYLDSKGLVALWREGLLAQKVLQGGTKGYTHHPQLIRFRKTANPVGAVADYLRSVADEADRRGYRFDREKIAENGFKEKIPVTAGQAEYELTHLLKKLKRRDPVRCRDLNKTEIIVLHPIFEKIDGDVEDWEIG